jgi:UrcA family protein
VKTSTRSVLALATTVSLGLSTASLAAPSSGDEFVTRVVRFNDLDISTAAGARTLYGRIASAARAVCREHTYDLARDCRARALDDAVHGVGSPLLISIHRSAMDNVEELVSR